uniref:Uncharacterized protein n=1 Tax=Pararge aegeria TaxID=116150 RepID=S4NV02_9NEOP
MICIILYDPIKVIVLLYHSYRASFLIVDGFTTRLSKIIAHPQSRSRFCIKKLHSVKLKWANVTRFSVANPVRVIFILRNLVKSPS